MSQMMDQILQPIKHSLLSPSSPIDHKIESLETLSAYLSLHLHDDDNNNNNNNKNNSLSQHILQYFTLPLLVHQLDTTIEQQLNVAIRILQKLFHHLPHETVQQLLLSSPSSSSSSQEEQQQQSLFNMDQFLVLGSNHGFSSVRFFILDQVSKLKLDQIVNNQSQRQNQRQRLLVHIVIKSFLDDEISIFKKSCQIMRDWVQCADSMHKQNDPLASDMFHFLFHISSENDQNNFSATENDENDENLSLFHWLERELLSRTTTKSSSLTMTESDERELASKRELYTIRLHEFIAQLSFVSEYVFLEQIVKRTRFLDQFTQQLNAFSMQNNVLSLLNMLEIVKFWCDGGSGNGGRSNITGGSGSLVQISIIEHWNERGLFDLILQILMRHASASSNDESSSSFEQSDLITNFILDLIAQVAHNRNHSIISDRFLCSSSHNDFIFDHLYQSLLMSPSSSSSSSSSASSSAASSLSSYSSLTRDVARQQSALIIIGNLCSKSSVAQRRFLVRDRERRRTYLSLMTEYANQDVLVTFLHSLAQVTEPLTLEQVQQQEREQELGQETVKLLFDELENDIIPTTHHFNNRLVNYLLDLIRTDIFPDIRHAVFHVLRSLAHYSWGVEQYLLAHPTFVSFLTNRRTEVTKEAKDWKYGIAEVMWSTMKRMHKQRTTSGTNNNEDDERQDVSITSVVNNLTTNQYVTLRVYLQRGPYLEDSEAAVAIQTKSA